MFLISYQNTHHTSYPTSLLKSLQLQQKSGHQADILLSSGSQAVSVPSVLLRNSSPLLSSLLQSPCHCPCSQSTSITLPSTLASALPSLVSLLYTGYVSNISREHVEQLKLLTKELGMRTSTGPEPRIFEMEDEVEISTAWSRQCRSSSGEGGDHSDQGDSRGLLSDSEHETQDISYLCDIENSNNSEENNLVRDTFNNKMTIDTIQKRKKKVKFIDHLQDDYFSRHDLVSMDSPVRPTISVGPVHIRIEPRDCVWQQDIVSVKFASDQIVSYGQVSDAQIEENFDVITVQENIVDREDWTIEVGVGASYILNDDFKDDTAAVDETDVEPVTGGRKLRMLRKVTYEVQTHFQFVPSLAECPEGKYPGKLTTKHPDYKYKLSKVYPGYKTFLTLYYVCTQKVMGCKAKCKVKVGQGNTLQLVQRSLKEHNHPQSIK